MADIRKLKELSHTDLHQLVVGYVSTSRYHVQKCEHDDTISIVLKRQELSDPYERDWPHLEEDFKNYERFVHQGFSFGVYEGDLLIGIAISEKQTWNRSLWIWEFHVAESHRGKGIGRQLMERVAKEAKEDGLRVLVCETQNTNVPAIDFYRKVGFEIGGVDLSHYTNTDIEDGEVALFMKRKLE